MSGKIFDRPHSNDVGVLGRKGIMFLKTLAFLVGVTLPFGVLAEVTQTYDNVEALMSAQQDYDSSNNTFEMLDVDKPHYRLSKIVFQNDLEEVVYYENWRAAIYGVYNVFAHTPIEHVTVTATPLEAESLMKMGNAQLLEDQSITLSISRDEALTVLSGLIQIDSLSDVKVPAEYGHQWSDDFNSVYFEDQQPGLDQLIADLNVFCRRGCE